MDTFLEILLTVLEKVLGPAQQVSEYIDANYVDLGEVSYVALTALGVSTTILAVSLAVLVHIRVVRGFVEATGILWVPTFLCGVIGVILYDNAGGTGITWYALQYNYIYAFVVARLLGLMGAFYIGVSLVRRPILSIIATIISALLAAIIGNYTGSFTFAIALTILIAVSVQAAFSLSMLIIEHGTVDHIIAPIGIGILIFFASLFGAIHEYTGFLHVSSVRVLFVLIDYSLIPLLIVGIIRGILKNMGYFLSIEEIEAKTRKFEEETRRLRQETERIGRKRYF